MIPLAVAAAYLLANGAFFPFVEQVFMHTGGKGSIIGTVLAVWLYWNFCGWLNILNCTLPPVGIILVLGYFLNKEKYQDVEVSETVNWFAVIGVVLGAVVANLVHWGIASINGMVVAAVCYLIGRAVEKK